MQIINELLDFIHISPTAYHASSVLIRMLEESGFNELKEQDSWDLKPGKDYYLQRNGSTAIAFRLGKKPPAESGFLIAGAHTDSPSLKVKFPVNPAKKDGKSHSETSNVEIYGGPILSTWLDRELSVAGVVNVRRNGHWSRELFATSNPAAVIPNLAIHLNKAVNKGFEYNRQDHMKALFPGKSPVDLICEQLGAAPEDVGEGDLFLVDPFKGTILSGKAFVSPRIDNLAMCHAVIKGFIDSPASDETLVAVFFDNEEVGSMTYQGAKSSFLNELLERITIVTGGGNDDYFRAKANSFLISADGAHAVHPNFPGKHDSNFAPELNKGPVLKMNAGYSYATNSESALVFEDICGRAGVEFQRFIGRSDIPSGGTIGAVSSSLLGIRTVDIGNPMLAMHSIRETAGVADHSAMIRILSEYYRNGI